MISRIIGNTEGDWKKKEETAEMVYEAIKGCKNEKEVLKAIETM